MKSTLTISTNDFCVTARATGGDLDRNEALNSIARFAAATMAAAEGLPHFTVDVNLAPDFEYRENVAAA